MGTDWNTDPDVQEITCYVDGGCSNNGGPNPVAYGSFKVYRDKSTLIYEDCYFPISSHGDAGRATNNMAEAISINKALTFFLHSAVVWEPNIRIVINSDSELTINQIKGYYRIKKPNLKKIAEDRKIIMGKIQERTGKDPKELFVFRKIARDRIFEVLGH